MNKLVKKYIVYGLGISGISTAKFLQKSDFKVVATDDNEKNLLDNSIKYPNLQFKKFDELEFDSDSVISFSPGIPLYYPNRHKMLDISTKTQAELVCDVEIFYNFNCANNNFIGITGTNGKSTTTSLIGFIFEKLNIPSQIGGNIGIPCFDMPQNVKDFSYILEVSSFQLDLIKKTKFSIACLTNITPDHIDRHGSLENYIAAKKRIFNNQNNQDFAIIGIDNEISSQIYNEFLSQNFKAQLIAISTRSFDKNRQGVYIVNNFVYINLFNQKFSCPINPLLKGDHNYQNIAFAIAVTCCSLIKKNNFNQANIEKIIKITEEFKGLKHRLQLVKNIQGINFINDSKATNAESTLNALKAFKNIFWIVGGKAKDGGLAILKDHFSAINKAYLIGESSEIFADFLHQNNVNYVKCQNLNNAFNLAFNDAKNDNSLEKNLILSPACASFDQWKNFEERGDFFCKLVNEL